MSQLNIKIGASVDRNLGVAYRTFVDQARRAATAVDAEMRKSARAIQREHQKADKEKERSFAKLAKEAERWQRQMVKDAEKAKKDEARAFEKAEKEKTRIAADEAKKRSAEEARVARENERHLQASIRRYHEVRKQNALQREADRKYIVDYASKGASAAGRDLMGLGRAALGKAVGIAGGLARAQGVNFDPSSIFQKNADLESTASDLSNSAYMAGDARNGHRVAVRELMNEAIDVGGKTGTDANDVLSGLQKFVGLTGDLQTGREVMGDLLKLAKASGTAFDDMAAAAGNVSANLPETADKAEQIKNVMRAIAGQGKMGAVEIKDLATQMAKLAAQAGQFDNKNSAETMVTLGVMTQMSRAKGGSPSAREAAGSISSFVGMLKTKKRAEEFESATGVKVFNTKTGMLRDPMQIIKEALKAKGMDPLAFKTIFQNMQGGRAVEGWATIYRRAGGGDAGLKAVEAEFERLKRATMSETEIRESFNRAMQTGQSQAEVFNQEMRKNAVAMQDALLPAVIALAPAFTTAAAKMSEIATSLFGPDKVQKQLDDTSTKARDVLDSAVTQVRGGKISAETEKQMAQSELEMRSMMLGAQSDASTAKKNRYGGVARYAAHAFDESLIGAAIGYIGGGSYGDGLGSAAIQKQDNEIQKKEWEAQNAKRLYEEMVTSNRILHQKIDQGLVVRVSNIDELKSEPGASGVDNSGRTPPPGAKPRGK